MATATRGFDCAVWKATLIATRVVSHSTGREVRQTFRICQVFLVCARQVRATAVAVHVLAPAGRTATRAAAPKLGCDRAESRNTSSRGGVVGAIIRSHLGPGVHPCTRTPGPSTPATPGASRDRSIDGGASSADQSRSSCEGGRSSGDRTRKDLRIESKGAQPVESGCPTVRRRQALAGGTSFRGTKAVATQPLPALRCGTLRRSTGHPGGLGGDEADAAAAQAAGATRSARLGRVAHECSRASECSATLHRVTPE